MFLQFLFIIIATLLIVWFFYLNPYSYWTKKGVKQVRPCIFFGDSWYMLLGLKNVLEWAEFVYHSNSDKCVGFYQFYQNTLMVKDPEIIKQITVKDFDHFTDHNSLFGSEETDAVWSGNLFSLKGQKWRDMRALLSGSFTSSKMRLMYGFISEASENFAQYFLDKNEDLIEVEIKNCFTRFSNDVIASTSFGIKVDSLREPNNEFYLMGKETADFESFGKFVKFIGMFAFPGLFKFLKIPFFSKEVVQFFSKIINDTIELRTKENVKRPDMIGLLLDVKKGVKDDEKKELDKGFAIVEESEQIVKSSKKNQIEMTNDIIISQAMIFFIAGFESVSTAMSFASYELAINPEIQEKLRKEIRETYEKCGGNVTYEHLLDMKYLDMVVSETLRLRPVSLAGDRVCVKPYTLKLPNNSIKIDVGDNIWIPISAIQMDPKFYPNPKKFDPDRFSEENKGNIQPYTYLPFGVGPRACIGSRFALLEIKSVLFHLLNRFEIVPVQKTAIPLKMRNSITALPKGGFPLGLKRLKY